MNSLVSGVNRVTVYFNALIASLVWVAVNLISFDKGFEWRFFLILRGDLELVCRTTEEYCLLYLLAKDFGFDMYFPLNLMA